jgi:hypothetical protein
MLGNIDQRFESLVMIFCHLAKAFNRLPACADIITILGNLDQRSTKIVTCCCLRYRIDNLLLLSI